MGLIIWIKQLLPVCYQISKLLSLEMDIGKSKFYPPIPDVYHWLHNDFRDGCAPSSQHADGTEYEYSEFQQLALKLHNEKRKPHRDTPPVKLNPKLCEEAVDCAQRILNRTTFDDLHDGEFTVNVASDIDGEAEFGHNGFVKNCALIMDDRSYVSRVLDERMVITAVNTWYDEVSSYDFSAGQSKDQTDISHFAQV